MFKRIAGSPFSGGAVALMSALLGGLSWAGLLFPTKPEERLQWLGVWFGMFFVGALWTFVAQAIEIHRLKTRFKPRAAMRYNPSDHSVYIQDGDVTVDGTLYREHMHHFGVVNVSAATMTRMRVVLDKMEPYIEHFTYLGKPVMIRGEQGDNGYFDLPVSDNKSPSKYAAFLNELVPINGAQTGYIIPYVDRQKITRDKLTRRLRYRIEGGDMAQAVYFQIEISYDETQNRYRVTQL